VAEATDWGRVDDDGTVYVREESGERVVGQYPDGTPEEALAYFSRKFADLDGQVGLLEQRMRGGANASDVAKAVRKLAGTVRTANAVGDLASLERRLAALGDTAGEATEKQTAESKERTAAALAERAAIVDEAEQLAAQDPAKAQWKQVTARLDELFARWQAHQQENPRLPKGETNELWRRFRAARSTLEGHRRAFFSELDAQHKDARQQKERIIGRAEQLASAGAGGIPQYRALLDEWKAAPRAGKKVDDALWVRFKAAGDVLYGAKAEADAQEDVEYGANLQQKLALLDEAEPLLKVTDRAQARERLTSIQRRWDAIGKVPRDQVRPIEDRLRRVEAAVKKLDEEHWVRTDPTRRARADDMTSQLEDAIARLEDDLARATSSGDDRAAREAREALDARRAWLKALGA